MELSVLINNYLSAVPLPVQITAMIAAATAGQATVTAMMMRWMAESRAPQVQRTHSGIDKDAVHLESPPSPLLNAYRR